MRIAPEDAYTIFIAALHKVTTIGWRGKPDPLAVVILNYKLPIFEPEVWLREFSCVTDALTGIGFPEDVIEDLFITHDAMSPDLGWTDVDRHVELLRYCREKKAEQVIYTYQRQPSQPSRDIPRIGTGNADPEDPHRGSHRHPRHTRRKTSKPKE